MGLNFPHSLTEDFRNTSAEYPYRFVEFDDSMIVGFGDANNAATLWKLKVKKNNLFSLANNHA